MATATIDTTKPRIESEKKTWNRQTRAYTVETIRFKLFGIKIAVQLDGGEEYQWRCFFAQGHWCSWKRTSDGPSARKSQCYTMESVMGDLLAKGVLDACDILTAAIKIMEEHTPDFASTKVRPVIDGEHTGENLVSWSYGYVFTDEVGSTVYSDYIYADACCSTGAPVSDMGFGVPFETEKDAIDACNQYYAAISG